MRGSADDRRRPEPWLIGSAAALFYLSFHSAYYNFDGVACAIAVELGDWNHLVHGNHLAYGVVGLIFDRLWRLMGYAGPAILPLQCLDSLLGGAGVGLFCSLLGKQRFPRGVALGAAAGLAVSQAYWFWSLEAQVYLLGVVFILLASGEIFSRNPRPIRLGIFQAFAILGHVGHAMFLPVAAYRLLKAGAGRRAFVEYASALTLTTSSAYAAAALFCVRPASPEGWRRWLLGSAALTLDRSFSWHGGYSLGGLGDWLLTTARLIVDPSLSGVGLLLAIPPLAAAVLAAVQFRRGARAGAVKACLLWIASYALLFLSWQPFLDVYRISDLIPLWLLAAVALESMPAGLSSAALAAWTAGAGLLNGRQSILPRAAAAANAPYQEALWLAEATPEGAWIVATSRGQVYIPYFARRKPLNMRYVDAAPELYSKLDRLAAEGDPVFITEATLREGDWRASFESYGLELIREENGRRLYRIKRRGIPRAARRRG